MPAPSGGSAPSTASRRCSPRRPPSAPSSARTRRAGCSRSTTCRSWSALFLAGERCDPADCRWVGRAARKPVIDHWWQTETGWASPAISAASACSRRASAAAASPPPATTWRALDEAGHRLPPGETGTLAIRLPLPPGCLPTLWQADDRFREFYLETFPGWYNTSDAGVVDADGYVSVMSRTDDIINVAGHRLARARWRRCWRRTRMSPNAPWSASRTPEGPGAARPRRAESRRDQGRGGRSARSWSGWCGTGSGPVAAFKTRGW